MFVLKLPARKTDRIFSYFSILHTETKVVSLSSLKPLHPFSANPTSKSNMPDSDPPPDEAPQTKSASSKPLVDRNGWDGKLRHPSKVESTSPPNSDRRAVLTNPEALEHSDYSDPDAPPAETLPADEDLLKDEPVSSTEIDLVHSRISTIPSLDLSRFTELERLCLRQNAITSIRFPEEFGRKLIELDLYDNLIKHVDGLGGFKETLEILDLSFNKIKHIKGVEMLKELRHLFFVQNEIKKIEGLEGLEKLTMLELGANKIRVGLLCFCLVKMELLLTFGMNRKLRIWRP